MSSHWAKAARKNLDRVMARLAAGDFNTEQPGVINAVLRIDVPDMDFVYEAAVGQARVDSDAPMTPAHQFHLASVAKTMTAVLLLQLWEEGALGPNGLDATLLELGLFDPAIVDRLHKIDGVSYGRQLTVRHLLLHRGGLKEAVVDDAGGTAQEYGGPAPNSYGARYRRDLAAHVACLQDPHCDLVSSGLATTKTWQMWDPDRPDDKEAGVINWFLATGASEAALWPPGERFKYSDTAYVILGLLSEHLSGKDLHRQWRERVFDPLGMDSSYLAYATDPDPAPWMRQVSDFFYGDIGGVSNQLNVSFDRGGGGVVSTVGDLNRFMQGLIQGRLFRNPETLVRMTQWRHYPGIEAPRAGVGLGIFAETTDAGTVVIGHSGAYGAKMYYEPETGIYFSGTVNQRIGVPYYWWKELFKAIHEAGIGGLPGIQSGR